MADLNSTQRSALHPGVDAQSWLGFEQRIQSRRFDALVASARTALANSDILLAEHALLEAREIRPDAAELATLEAELATLIPRQPRFWRRAASALVLFVVGVSMFVFLDAMRILPGTLSDIAPPAPQLLSATPTPRSLEVPLAALTEPTGQVGTTQVADFDAPAEIDTPAEIAASAEIDAARIESPSMIRSTSAAELSGMRRTPRVDGTPARERAGLEVTASPAPRSSIAAEVQQASDPSALPATTRATAPVEEPPSPLAGARPAVRASAPLPKGVVPAAPSPASAPAGPAAVANAAADQSRVAEVLRRYARAYGELNVDAAREVWPAVDERALARAFESLSSQSVSFDDCRIDVRGVTANASCRGHTSYVGKVGRSAPRVEPRTWRFELRRDGDTWKIEHAEARRVSGSAGF